MSVNEDIAKNDSDITDSGRSIDSDLTDVGEPTGDDSFGNSISFTEFSIGDECLAPYSEDKLFYKASIVSIEKRNATGPLATVKYDGYNSSCNEIHSFSSLERLTLPLQVKKEHTTSPSKACFKRKDEFMRTLYASSSDDETSAPTKGRQIHTLVKSDCNEPLTCRSSSKQLNLKKSHENQDFVSCYQKCQSETGDIHSYDSGEKPCFDFPAPGPKEPLVISQSINDEEVQVPATINQYLRDYQRDGIHFLHSHYNLGHGCILGDDMGLGKTIQIIAFLSAVFGKYGDNRDLFKVNQISVHIIPIRYLSEHQYKPKSKQKGIALIVSPASVLYNWIDELATWGHFKVAKFHGASKKDALNKALDLRVEILLTTYETLRNHLDELNEVEWLAAVMDEAHRIKEPGSSLTIASKELNVKCRIALTGTPLQNNMSELWCLLDWANPGCLGTQDGFEKKFAAPIKKGQRFDATKRELATARKLQRQLSVILGRMLLRRTKDLIKSQLPEKDERVVFCSMAPIQQSIYDQLLSSDEVSVIINKNKLCSCGSGSKVIECCFKEKFENETIRGLTLKYLNLLLKAANHAALLLPRTNQTEDQKAKALETCENLFPIFPELKDMFNAPSLYALSDHRLCGKLKVMENLLNVSSANGDKVLLFSYSTQLLNILESYVISRGFSYLRLDGDTKTDQRSKLVSQFNTDSEIFLCLISTRAGSLGLNFTGANVVLIFDPMWNPSHDMQAQDRAYRIGQRRNVRVYRLISTNSIEENIYLRQVYKQQLSGLTIEGKSERRLFNAVQGKKGTSGEIFGVENLFVASSSGSLAQKLIERTEKLENGIKSSSYMLTNQVNLDKHNNEEIGSDGEEETDDEEHLSQIIDDIPDNSTEKKTTNNDMDNILDNCGVDFVHSNKALLASSKREEHLSRKAIKDVFWDGLNSQDPANQSSNDELSDEQDSNNDTVVSSTLKPSTSCNESKRVFERRGNVMFLMGHVPPAIIQKQVDEMAQINGYGNTNEFLAYLKSSSTSDIAKLLRSYYLNKEPDIKNIQSFEDAFNLDFTNEIPKTSAVKKLCKKRKTGKRKQRQRRSTAVNPYLVASKRHLKSHYPNIFDSSSDEDNSPKQGYKSFTRTRKKLLSSDEEKIDGYTREKIPEFNRISDDDDKACERSRTLTVNKTKPGTIAGNAKPAETLSRTTTHSSKSDGIATGRIDRLEPFSPSTSAFETFTLSSSFRSKSLRKSRNSTRYTSALDELLDDNYDESYIKISSPVNSCPSSPSKRKKKSSLLDDLLNSDIENDDDDDDDNSIITIDDVPCTTKTKQRKSILDDFI